MSPLTLLLLLGIACVLAAAIFGRRCWAWNRTVDGRCDNSSRGLFRRCHQHGGDVTFHDFAGLGLLAAAAGIGYWWATHNGIDVLIDDITAALA